jgi:hypothetical protein
VITPDAKCETEIRNRIKHAQVAFYKIKSKIFDKPIFSDITKVRVYKVQVLPALLWGCETWAVSAKVLKELEVQHMNSLGLCSKFDGWTMYPMIQYVRNTAWSPFRTYSHGDA